VNQLDHIVIAAADLDAAIAQFADETGCVPSPGGSHRGLGTKNALASFGSDCYLELIAPDPAQQLEGTFGEMLLQLPQPQPLHWAIRSRNLPGVADSARALGFVPSKIRDTSRMAPDGARLDWQLLGLSGHNLGGLVPFFIDWLACAHPAIHAPRVGPLQEFTIRTMHDGLQRLISQTTGVQCTAGDALLSFCFTGDKGEFRYRATSPTGFKL